MKIAVKILLVVFSLAGCAVRGESLGQEELLSKASALTTVAAMIDAAVRYDAAAAEMSGEDLLNKATAHDPGVLDPFKELKLRVRREALNSSILVCTADGKTALIEDTACTGQLDARLWEREPRPACDFQLDLAALCRGL